MNQKTPTETPITVDEYFESQAYFNKWLKELTDLQSTHLKEMLEEYATISHGDQKEEMPDGWYENNQIGNQQKETDSKNYRPKSTPLLQMDESVKALYLELPEDIANDVAKKWKEAKEYLYSISLSPSLGGGDKG